MKVFQIFNDICHWDATPLYPTVADTVGLYAPDIVFIEAPDYVFEGWGYDSTEEGDDRFIMPEPPEHWLYDPKTGTYYPDPDDPFIHLLNLPNVPKEDDTTVEEEVTTEESSTTEEQ